MGTKGTTSYRIGDQNAPHYITTATIGWVDIFTRKRYKDIIGESLVYCRANKRLEIYGYCIMTNHIHLICRAKEGDQLSDILRDFRRHTAKQILKSLQDESESRREWLLDLLEESGSKNRKNKKYQVWQQDNHPIELFSDEVTRQKLDYVHNNPVTEGFVSHPVDYIY
jgi:putative transposase